MTLFNIIDTLKKISLTQPNIRTATDGDIFDKMNGNPSVKYGVFHVVQTTHTEDEQFDNYGFNLFVIDRLEDDDANRISAQSTAKQILSNIIATFCETFDAEHEVITYLPFTQRFKDNTCGVWASVTMQVVKDYSCAESYGEGAWYPEIVVINNEDITITENGVYEPSEGYTGFGKVEVALDIPVVQDKVYRELASGEDGTIVPDEGYTAMAEVEYVIKTSEKDKMHIPNGVNFSGSTIEYFPYDDYNWEWLHDGTNLFRNCSNMKNAGEILEKVRDGELDVWTTNYMFEDTPVEVIDGIDFSRYYSFTGMFRNMPSLKEVRNCVYPNYKRISSQASYPLTTTTDDAQTRFKVVDCDFSKLNPYTYSTTTNYGRYVLINFNGNVYPYFINFKYPSYYNSSFYSWGGDTQNTARRYDCLLVQECENLNSSGTTTDYTGYAEMWYRPDLTTWKGQRCYPWGLWFQVINKPEEVKSIYYTPVDERIKEVQVLDNVGNGRFEALYPLFQQKQVNIEMTDGTIVSPSLLRDTETSTTELFNTDIYVPDTELKSSYEGGDIQNVIYYVLPVNVGTPESGRTWTVTDDGLAYADTMESRISSPRLYIASNASLVKLTLDINYDASTYGDFEVYLDGVKILETAYSKTLVVTITPNSDVSMLSFKRDTYKNWDMTITKIEYL